jgi:transposase
MDRERGQHHRQGPSTLGGSAAAAGPVGAKKGIEHPNHEGLGRSRGGLTTKIHMACDGKGRPLSIVVTSGQTHESSQLAAVLDAISVPRRTVGRPRKRPDLLIADRGYSYPSSRRLLRSRKIPHMIPERSDQRERRFGRPPVFDADVYARRNVAERCVNKLKQWRGIATRYEKRALNYRAAVVIAALMTWLAM